MEIITATKDTFLKKQPVQSSNLSDSEKKAVSRGETYPVSKYFRTVEVTKNDRNRLPKPNSNEEKDILKLAVELDKLREDWASALIVTSWFRPSTRLGYAVDVNRRVGGAYNSQHIYGRGVEIYPRNGKLAELQNLCLQNWRGGVGKGLPKGFVHLDTRSGTPTWKAGQPTAVWIY